VELPDIEVVSAAVHEAWMDTKLAKGVSRDKTYARRQVASISAS
jgi:hypothetical protein